MILSAFTDPEKSAGSLVQKSEKVEDAQPAFKKKIKIGTKPVLGVALASNLCILMLLYSVRYWYRKALGKMHPS